MLAFTYVCATHRQDFVDTVTAEGCRDAAAMEQVRRHLLAWLSENYPRLVLDSFNGKSCIGCALDAHCLDLAPMYATLRRHARTAATAA